MTAQDSGAKVLEMCGSQATHTISAGCCAGSGPFSLFVLSSIHSVSLLKTIAVLLGTRTIGVTKATRLNLWRRMRRHRSCALDEITSDRIGTWKQPHCGHGYRPLTFTLENTRTRWQPLAIVMQPRDHTALTLIPGNLGRMAATGHLRCLQDVPPLLALECC